MWKLQDLSATQILREINFGESRSSKFAIFGALDCVNLVDFNLQKVQKCLIQTSEPLDVIKDFEAQDSPTLISFHVKSE